MMGEGEFFTEITFEPEDDGIEFRGALIEVRRDPDWLDTEEQPDLPDAA